MKSGHIAAVLIVVFAAPSRAQDGNAIMKKVVATYAGLQSYSHTSSSTRYTRVGRRTESTGTTAEARVRKPNRFYISLTNPSGGSNVFLSDGREIVAYSGKLNQYVRGPAPDTLAEATTALNRLSISNFGTGFSTDMDALYFLQGRPLPSGGALTVRKGTENLDNLPCYVVDGSFTSGGKAAGKIQATLWIETATSLIRKVALTRKGIQAVVPVRAMNKGKPAIMAQRVVMDIMTTERIIVARPNDRQDDNAFRFIPPKGATERNLTKYLKK